MRSPCQPLNSLGDKNNIRFVVSVFRNFGRCPWYHCRRGKNGLFVSRCIFNGVLLVLEQNNKKGFVEQKINTKVVRAKRHSVVRCIYGVYLDLSLLLSDDRFSKHPPRRVEHTRPLGLLEGGGLQEKEKRPRQKGMRYSDSEKREHACCRTSPCFLWKIDVLKAKTF